MRRCLGALFAFVIGYAVPAGPAAQGQTGQIAFATNRATGGHDDVYVMNADGSAPIAKTSDASREERAPAWSADGTRIAFQSAIPNVTSFQIVVMNADGSGQTALTNGDDSEPSWSPDGTRIAFTSFRSGSGDIYVMNADGTQQTQRTNDPATDSDPDWSPNGAQIVFVTKRDSGISHVYVMNADGTGAIRLTNTTMHDAMPEWSPDGTKIAFARLESGGYEIYVMNADGSGQTRLTNSSGHDLSPTWSPDGTMIAFSTVRDGNEEIYVMNSTDGSNLTNVSNNPARDGYPAWKPALGGPPPPPPSDTDGDGNPDDTDPFPLDPLRGHAVFVVNSTADVPDAAPGNGICATAAAGECTLRAAVQEANALAGPDTIHFTGTTITLTGAAGEDAAASGDLDVTAAGGPLTIVGNGAGNTIIQGCGADVDSDCVGIDRLFDVQDGASLTLSGVTLRNGSAGTGGAIRVGTLPPWASPGQATLVLDASEVVGNRSTGSGGGVYSTFGIVSVTDSVFADNEAVFHGGAIVNNLGTLTIDRSTIDGNRAATGEGAGLGHGGGAIFNGASGPTDVTITNSTISGNSADHGGGIYNNGLGQNGVYRISNSTFSGNSATMRGGAILNSNGAVHLASVTISGNSAATGGGIVSWLNAYSAVAPVVLGNTIVANSVGGNCATFSDIGPATIASEGYSLSDDNTCALGATGDLNNEVAGLAPLADNGGPTLTHMLLGSSRAIDAGNTCTDTAGTSLTTDQRGAGFPRAIDGDADGTPVCDIGAVESDAIAANTPPGENVFVQPEDAATHTSPATLTFEGVDAPGGATSLTISDIGPAPPAGFRLGDPPTYYEITTTATFSGSVQVCVTYTGISFANESTLRLFHFEDTDADGVSDTWMDRTAPGNPDSLNDRICGIVESLSPFVIVEPEPGTLLFALPTEHPVPGGSGFFVTSGDLNGDGDADLVAANGATATVSILLGDGAGGIASTSTFASLGEPYPNGGGANQAGLGDFNEDGREDIALAVLGANGVEIRLGNGDGTFGPPTLYAMGSLAMSIVVQDLNGDGHLDVATANMNSGDVSVRLGNGTGVIGEETALPVGAQPIHLAAGDLNHDGRPDLVASVWGDQTAAVLLALQGGGYAPPVPYPTQGGTSRIAIGDLNGDGHPDLVSSNPGANTVSVRLGDGTGIFAEPTQFAAGMTPESVSLADFDGDGALDVATANSDTAAPMGPPAAGSLNVLLGDGTGSLAAPMRLLPPWAAPAAGFPGVWGTAADLNHDGLPDLALASSAVESVAIFLNVTDPDPDGDGLGNSVDPDDDGDLVLDGEDAFPLDQGESVDTDQDGTGNNLDRDDDNDGIEDDIDPASLDFSDSFSDLGPTTGSIVDRGGWDVTVTNVDPGGVLVSVTGAGTTVAVISVCANGGAETIELDADGETAAIECVNTTGEATGSHVTAGSSSPETNPDVIVRDSAEVIQAHLSNGQSVTVGSPITADPDNVGSILVELVDETRAIIGSFDLEPTESVDVALVQDANGDSALLVDVKTGEIVLSAFGRETTIDEHDMPATVSPDNEPPVITVPGNIVAEATGPSGAVVTFSAGAVDAIGGPVPVTCTPESGSPFPIDTTVVTCRAADAIGNAAHASFTVTVRDTTPPTINGLSVDRPTLWPPNHQMVAVALAYQVRDVVDPAPTCSLGVRSNEPVNGTGDGDTAPDWQIVDARRLLLRAERSGKGSGRIYTIEVTCTDASGNSSRAQTLVNVPKSQGR